LSFIEGNHNGHHGTALPVAAFAAIDPNAAAAAATSAAIATSTNLDRRRTSYLQSATTQPTASRNAQSPTEPATTIDP
jgi:hypothetical protein